MMAKECDADSRVRGEWQIFERLRVIDDTEVNMGQTTKAHSTDLGAPWEADNWSLNEVCEAVDAAKAGTRDEKLAARVTSLNYMARCQQLFPKWSAKWSPLGAASYLEIED